MSTELKPCPFCGSNELPIYESEDGALYVACRGCGCKGPKSCERTMTMDLWNSRVLPEIRVRPLEIKDGMTSCLMTVPIDIVGGPGGGWVAMDEQNNRVTPVCESREKVEAALQDWYAKRIMSQIDVK